MTREPTGYRNAGRISWIAGAILLLFLLLPLVVTIWGSGWSGLTTVVRQLDIMRSIGLTFLAALIATAIALVLGTPLAYQLARRDFHGKSLIEGLIDIPLVIPHTAAGIALLMVFGTSGTGWKTFCLPWPVLHGQPGRDSGGHAVRERSPVRQFGTGVLRSCGHAVGTWRPHVGRVPVAVFLDRGRTAGLAGDPGRRSADVGPWDK